MIAINSISRRQFNSNEAALNSRPIELTVIIWGGGLSVCDLITRHTLFAMDLNHHHKSLFPDRRERSLVHAPVAELALLCCCLQDAQ